MQPSTSYPKTVGGVCYAIIRAHTERVKTTISNYPIIGQEARHAIPACNNTDKLSQHAVAQSQVRHAIPACS